MTLRIHHLNCGTLCPVCQRLINGEGSWLKPGQLVCHCLLIEAPDTLILVDTGIGMADINDAWRRLGFAGKFLRPKMNPEEAALSQLKALGYDPRDLRHIITTHLDLDHAGGLADFPEAQVHVMASELEAALRPSWHDMARYRAPQFSHQPHWQPHVPAGEDWFGFTAIPAIPGMEDQLMMIPLPGHSHGHCGVAVKTRDHWLLHAGDAYFHRGTLLDIPAISPGAALIERIDEVDPKQRRSTQERLRTLHRQSGDQVQVFCSHDPVEWEALAR